ncbi:MAG TPA: outer membrane beta-barrel protein [Candidatus Acidoferrales bacterium]|nr:outer membrane beta-barrel protein [Candidatus Acidoferrales bacterium]
MFDLSIRQVAGTGVLLACALALSVARAQATAPTAAATASPVLPTPLPESTVSQNAPLTVSSPMPSSTPVLRRALPQPFDPLFPSGGEFLGPTIGVPTAAGLRAYGWLNAGLEASTSAHSNFPLSYNDVPNAPELDQFVFRFERQPDTVQTDHFDWGFRVSNLYGADYRWTTMQGFLSNQLLLRNQTNGYDAPEAYGILYWPRWGEGTTLQVGRYISPPDIEAQLAPNNFFYTHSLMFDFDAYTQMGLLFSTKLSNYWTIQYGVHCGNDTACWDGSFHFPTFLVMARWVSHSNRDSILFGIDSHSFDGGNFKTYEKGTYYSQVTNTEQPLIWGHDDLQQQNVTWTHVFNPTLQNELEGYYIYQHNAYVGGTINNYNVATGGPPYLGAGGGPGAFIPGLSEAIGAVDYFSWKFSPADFATFRLDYLNDPQGERSGFATSYGSLTWGVTHYINPKLMVRPEFRIETAFKPGVTPYDNGTKAYQTTFGIDAIQFFGNDN